VDLYMENRSRVVVLYVAISSRCVWSIGRFLLVLFDFVAVLIDLRCVFRILRGYK
jgi:hypothetical protein